MELLRAHTHTHPNANARRVLIDTGEFTEEGEKKRKKKRLTKHAIKQQTMCGSGNQE